MQKGEITAFLSLIFLLILSLLGAIIESASIQVLKNHKRADTSLAVESVFAEYQKELLEEYDVFALDGSYGDRIWDERKLTRRLEYYGAQENANKIQRSELLTDNMGAPFYRQAVRYMENKIGIDHIDEDSSYWEEQEESGKDFEKAETEVQENLESMLEETQESLPSENNPMESVSSIQKSNLLQIIVENPEQLSEKSIKKEELASIRKLNRGKGNFMEKEKQNEVTGKLFFRNIYWSIFPTLRKKRRNMLWTMNWNI